MNGISSSILTADHSWCHSSRLLFEK